MAQSFRERFDLEQSREEECPSWDEIVSLIRRRAPHKPSLKLHDWADFVEGCEQLRNDLDA